MFGFEVTAFAGMAMGMFLGGLAKGISGVALPLVAIAVALFFVDVPASLAMIAMSLVVTNIWQAASIGDVRAPIKRFWPLILSFVVSLYLGSLLINILDGSLLFGIVGVIAIVFALMQFWQPSGKPMGSTAEKIFGPVAGLIGGVLGGLTSIWGPPMIIYLFLLRLPKDVFVQTITTLYLLGAVPLVFFYYINGILDGQRMWLSIVMCVPALAGIILGNKVRNHIDDALFKKVLLVVLFVIGLNMIRRAFV